MCCGPQAGHAPGQNRDDRFFITVPTGVRAGQQFAVLVNGQQMSVRCPAGVRPGERVIVTVPSYASSHGELLLVVLELLMLCVCCCVGGAVDVVYVCCC